MNKLLIPFFTAGYPQINSTASLVRLFDETGADYIEVGLPHSDALADGPVIQQSSHKALQAGMNLSLLCEQISTLKDSLHKAKLVLFSYYNPLLAFGLTKACTVWKEAGGHSLLVPDLPFEESAELLSICQDLRLNLIFLIAPTSTPQRIEKIARISKEFIYLVSVTGVTGIREAVQNDLSSVIQMIRQVNSQVKVVIGFGISSVEQASMAIKQGADGVVLGSVLLKIMNEDKSFEKMKLFMSSLRASL